MTKYFNDADPGSPHYRLYDRGGTATLGGKKVKAGDPAVEGDGLNPILKSIDDRIDVEETLHPLGASEVVSHHARLHTMLDVLDHSGNLTQTRSHDSPDTDTAATSLHHTLDATLTSAVKAAPANHSHAPQYYEYPPFPYANAAGTFTVIATETPFGLRPNAVSDEVRTIARSLLK